RGHGDDLSRWRHPDLSALHSTGPVAADLDVGGKTDTEIPILFARGGLPFAELLIIDVFERPVQRFFVLARIVERTERRLVGEIVGCDEVLPPKLDWVFAEFARTRGRQPFDDVGRLGPAGTPIGRKRRRVREHTSYFDVGGGDVVLAEQSRAEGGARDAGPALGEIRPHA